jgi:hypothetical protein
VCLLLLARVGDMMDWNNGGWLWMALMMMRGVHVSEHDNCGDKRQAAACTTGIHCLKSNLRLVTG